MALGFSNPIVGGTTLIREAIRSPNYVAGSSGWAINRDGTVEFSSGTFRGSLHVQDAAGSYVDISTSDASQIQVHKAGIGAGDWYLRVNPGGGYTAAAWSMGFNSEIGAYPPGDVFPNQGSVLILGATGQAIRFPNNARLYAGQAGAPSGTAGTLTLGQIGTGLNYDERCSLAVTGTLNVAQGTTLQSLLTAQAGISQTGNNLAIQNTGSNGASGTSAIYASNGKAWLELTAGTGASWSDQNVVASSPSGNAGMALRTSPVAVQLRLGTAANDLYFMNAGGGAAVTLQAAAYVIFSRADSKRDVAELEHDALALVRAMRPVRYRSLAELPDVADHHHLLNPKLRGRTPVETGRRWAELWESSNTHLGFVVEELEQLCPDLIHPGDDGAPRGYSLGGMVALLTRSVQQLAAELEAIRGPHRP